MQDGLITCHICSTVGQIWNILMRCCHKPLLMFLFCACMAQKSVCACTVSGSSMTESIFFQNPDVGVWHESTCSMTPYEAIHCVPKWNYCITGV